MPPLLALTLGDPAGVGPEISLKAWRILRDAPVCFVAMGHDEPWRQAAELLDLPRPEIVSDLEEARRVFSDSLPILRLDPSDTPPEDAVKSIESAVAAALRGDVAGLVTNPISKSRLYDAGFGFPGHTEFIAHLTQHATFEGARGPVMMLSGGGLRTALVTIHTPLKRAIEALDTASIVKTAQITAEALSRDFGLSKPRLAIAGLNPHAGENGALGDEEITLITPAITALKQAGFNVTGPMPPDTMFHEEARAQYDAAICLYHDQGLIPVKTLDFHGGVNVSLGLPVVRTSPDHGTAFDIAGQGIARPDSLVAAIELATQMAQNRKAHEAGAQ